MYKEKKPTSREGPSVILIGSLFSSACSHDLMARWSSLRCPHFGFLGKPVLRSGLNHKKNYLMRHAC